MNPEKMSFNNIENLSKGEELLREARFLMERKGFKVDQAGLDMQEGGTYTIGGRFSVDDETKLALAQQGISVVEGSGGKSSLSFDPTNLDQEAISKKMLEIAQMLPDSSDNGEEEKAA